MLIDIRTLPEDTIIESEICIVGAGAAGITLAREFIDQPHQVCLLESGGLDFDEVTQSLYEGENIGTSYFPLWETRARYFGGSTNLWGGWSRPLDDVDFEDRPWMLYSGWPITKAELLPYYQRAQKACQLGPFEYDLAYWKDVLENFQLSRPPLGEEVETYIWQIIPQDYLRFGQAYRREIEQARNISAYLHANVVEIEANETAGAVTRLRVADLEGKQYWVQAKVFILASGGIENPRLLLASNKVQSNGLGNQYDLVGRFFMEHPYIKSGEIMLLNPPALYTQARIQVGEMNLGTGLGLSKAIQERQQILNSCLRLLPLIPDWMKAFNRLRYRFQKKKKFEKKHEAFPSVKHFEELDDGSDTSVIEDLGKVTVNFHQIVAKAYAKLFDKSSSSKKKSNLFSAYFISEQAPNPDSRITLSTERDKLGLNRVKLDWRLSDIDKQTILHSQKMFEREFARCGLGQLQIKLTDNESFWKTVAGSYHHMGTTRMSTNPRQGVVNEDCQVYGISNLYIAGSSVFPTSGLANPTLTIIALAIRLADRIKELYPNTGQ